MDGDQSRYSGIQGWSEVGHMSQIYLILLAGPDEGNLLEPQLCQIGTQAIKGCRQATGSHSQGRRDSHRGGTQEK